MFIMTLHFQEFELTSEHFQFEWFCSERISFSGVPSSKVEQLFPADFLPQIEVDFLLHSIDRKSGNRRCLPTPRSIESTANRIDP